MRHRKKLNITRSWGLVLGSLWSLGWPGVALAADAPREEEKSEVERLMELPLEELMSLEVESVSKHVESIFWSSAAVSTYSREDVACSGARTVADFLRRVAGVDVYQVKTTTPMVGVRSLTDKANDRILLVVDGREELMEMVGFPLWPGLTFDLEDIERIEVIRGAASTLYGANAFLGVVNITTIAQKPDGMDAYVTLGEQGTQRIFGRLRGHRPLRAGNLGYSLSARRESYRSVSDPDYQQRSPLHLHGFARYGQGDWLELTLSGSVGVGEFPIYTQMGEMDMSDGLAHFVVGKAKLALSDRLKLSLQLYHNRYFAALDTRMKVMAWNTWVADIPPVEIDTHIGDAQVQLDFEATDKVYLIGGGSIRYSHSDGKGTLPTEVDETRGAAFLQAQWQVLEKLQLLGGARADFNELTDSSISPRAFLVVRPAPNHSLRLGYGMAFRKPVFLEHSIHFDFQNVNPLLGALVAPRDPKEILGRSLGNPAVINERVQSLEAGWFAHLQDATLQISVQGFFNRYLNIMYLDLDAKIDGILDAANIPDDVFVFRNEPEVMNALGGELEISYRPTPPWLAWANAGIRRVFWEKNGNRVTTEPTLRINAGGRYAGELGFIADLSFHYVSTYVSWQANPPNLPSPHIMTLGDSVLAIGRLGYRLGLSGPGRILELGMTTQTPVGRPFRETSGFLVDPGALNPAVDTTSDFGGEVITRALSGYLRLTY